VIFCRLSVTRHSKHRKQRRGRNIALIMERNPEARSCRTRCPELLLGDSSMKLSVHSTTGTRFELSVPPEETVDGLKRRLAERLRVPRDRLLLLHRDLWVSPPGSGSVLGIITGSIDNNTGGTLVWDGEACNPNIYMPFCYCLIKWFVQISLVMFIQFR